MALHSQLIRKPLGEQNAGRRPAIQRVEIVNSGAAEQVKQLLHRNSELLLQRNFEHLGYMKGVVIHRKKARSDAPDSNSSIL